MPNALILAGGKTKGELKNISSAEHKALIKIKNKYMVEYVLDALKNSKKINKIVLVGPEKELQYPNDKLKRILPSSDTMLENVLKGVKELPDEENVLIVSADIPLIKSEMIDNFLLECEKKPADIYYPIIRKEINLAKYPKAKRTYAKVKEGAFTGGNFLLVNPEVLISQHSLFEEVINSRKSPLKLVKILGAIFILRFLLSILGLPGGLTISSVEKKIQEILKGKKIIAIICPYPEVGFDIDKVSDLNLVKEILEK